MSKLKKLLLVLPLIIICFCSCSKDDSTQQNAVSTLEGKWQFTKEGTITNNQETLTDYQHTSDCTKDYTEILTGNILKDHYFNNPNCEETIDTGTWNKNNNSLVFSYPNEPNVNAEILELSNTTLKVKFVLSGVTYLAILTRIQ